MAGSTFLQLTNRVLRRINEVELTETNFASTRGIQSLVKDCVNDAIREINQQKWEWPYHAVETTQLLQEGVSEYPFPSDFKSADWNTFQIMKDDTLNTTNQILKLIDRNEWYRYQRDIDYDNIPDGMRIPNYVFKTYNGGFGVTPSPDLGYTVKYRYFKNEVPMSLFSDTTDIPTNFNNVITSGALYHMNLFRENPQGVTIAQNNFTAGVKDMYSILVGEVSPYATSSVINQGGVPYLNRENYNLC